MIEPWDIKQDCNRLADSLPTFIIFCEDEVSEPDYFKFFETPKIKINFIVNQKSKTDHVVNAICHCKEQGLMDSIDGLSYLKDEDIQVWCVFDRDREETDHKVKLGNVHFDESIEMAKAKGFKIAWSNDAFELWVLLHFEDVDLTDEKYNNRKTYYDSLTEIFKNIPNPNSDLVKILNHPSFNYKQDLKREKKFKSIVRNEIVGKTKVALEKATKLEEAHNLTVKPNHEKTPLTMVHHLVKELIRLGGKEV